MLRLYYNIFQSYLNSALSAVFIISLVFASLAHYHIKYFDQTKYVAKSGLQTTLNINNYSYRNRSSKNFGGSNSENLKVNFDLEINNFADYLSNYKYNLKQIFLYLVLEYDNNSIVIYDQIIPIDDIVNTKDLVIKNKEANSVWHLKNKISDYQKDFQFKVMYDAQPRFGFLTTKEFEVDNFNIAKELL